MLGQKNANRIQDARDSFFCPLTFLSIVCSRSGTDRATGHTSAPLTYQSALLVPRFAPD